MIDLYTARTPNGRKISIMLEEVDLPYTVHALELSKGDQFASDFVAINPNSKIPAIVDQDAKMTLFESGAILMYLAEKTGLFFPSENRARYQVIQWLMFQMGNVGPMFGQLGHFTHGAPEPVPYAIARYEKETLRLYGVLDGQLRDREFLCDDYSIADIATYPWVAIYGHLGLSLDDYPHLQRWVDTIKQRPAVQRGMAVPA